MTSLGNFAGVAYQTVLFLQASRKAEQRLSDANAETRRFAAIVHSSDDAILSKNLDGIIESWNSGAERLFGYTTEETIGKPVTMLIPPDRLNEEPEILSRIRRGERIEHFDTQRLRKDGSLVDISLTISPVRDAIGQVIGASKIARDIGERRHAQRRQDLIVEEMKHRIKNTLSIVQAIAMRTLRETPTEERDVFIARLHSLSNAHDLLTRENWDRASLLDLVTRTLEPFRTKKHDSISINGPLAWLDANASTLLTIVIHELATNAAKYGALSASAGRVSITWELQDKSTQFVILRWHESGGPTVVTPERQGFGSLIIKTMLKSELGEPELQFLPDGVVCRLSFHCSDGSRAAERKVS